MKILYDHQAFTMQYYGGVSKCFCELISNLPTDVVSTIGIEESNNIHLQTSGLCPNLNPVTMDFNCFVKQHRFRGRGRLYLWANRMIPFLKTTEHINKKRSIQLLKEGDFDVFHPTFFDDYFLKYLNGKPFVLTIHDMMPELFPEYFGKNDMQILAKRKLVNKASAIIAVSEQTKKDVIDILNVPEEKIHVIYHGGPDIETVNITSPYTFPYFLYIGQRGQYKNFEQLLKDFSAFKVMKNEYKLICTGPQFSESEKELLLRYKLMGCVQHENATDEYLKILYANAEAFIYPSLYEGFGIPILEAYAYGCPVILNNKSCFPEIAGDAAIYFDSNGCDSNLAEILMSFYAMSDSERQTLIQKGYQRLALFSWQKSAYKLSKLYKSIL